MHSRKASVQLLGSQCNNCQKMNHFAVKCRAAKKNTTAVNAVEDDFELISSLITTEDIHAVGEKYQRQLFATMNINDADVTFQLDSAATCNVISRELLRKVCEPELEIQSTTQVLSMY